MDASAAADQEEGREGDGQRTAARLTEDRHRWRCYVAAGCYAQCDNNKQLCFYCDTTV